MILRRAFQVVIVALAAASPALAQVGKSVTIVDANVATEKELAAMPHLAAATVKAIVDARPFASISDLDARLSKSLSRPQLTELYGRLFVHLNLNTATREQILAHPEHRSADGARVRGVRPYRTSRSFTARSTSTSMTRSWRGSSSTSSCRSISTPPATLTS